LLRDLNGRQSHLFFLIATFLLRYEPAQLPALIDEDVAASAAALAGTYETALRGVIYEHRPASLPAARLADALDAMLADARKLAPALFERDAAVVLRRIEECAHSLGPPGPSGGTRAFFQLLARVIRQTDSPDPDSAASEAPRLIVP
jgi:hypothetical protein